MLTTSLWVAFAASAIAAKDIKPAAGAHVKLRGVHSNDLDKYTPTGDNTWKCLDGSKEISWEAVNDDYCDCPDGSDEPGTSACPNAVFHCANAGHIPGTILSSRVNDGICDEECCDGSDEWATPGLCPDRCQEIGDRYRKEQAALLKIRKTGSKIRSTYIKYAQAEKVKLQEKLDKAMAAIEAREREVEQAKLYLDKMESANKDDLERKKQSPLYTNLVDHKDALDRLRNKSHRLQSELDELKLILEELSKGYNPNYQDMAVKAAVVGYQELYGAQKTGESTEDAIEVSSEDDEEIGDADLDEILKRDLESILLSSDIGPIVEDDDLDTIYRLEEYIPDALYDSYDAIREFTVEWLIRLGIIGKGAKSVSKTSASDGPHVAAARTAYNDVKNALDSLRRDVTSSTAALEQIESDYGPDAEWKKLEDTCIEKIAGDYTYSLCFFGRASQKSNRDGATNTLGNYHGWAGPAEASPADEAFYQKQLYNRGAKCWNGPDRSVQVHLSCGTQNELLSISEPEKCEYHFKATTPALCWPVQEQAVNVKEEL